jgi:hypothetical protein
LDKQVLFFINLCLNKKSALTMEATMTLLIIGGSSDPRLAQLLVVIAAALAATSFLLYLWLRKLQRVKPGRKSNESSNDLDITLRTGRGKPSGCIIKGKLDEDEIVYLEYDQLPLDNGIVLETAWGVFGPSDRLVVWGEIDRQGAKKILSVTMITLKMEKKYTSCELFESPEVLEFARTVLNFGRQHFARAEEKLAKGESLD